MSSSTNAESQSKPIRVVFLHLDLGIGGAEQLVLQLAQASTDCQHSVALVTTRCDPHHCFEPVKPNGSLHASLRVWGRWIPADVFGYGRTWCSTMRVLYLTMVIILGRDPLVQDADVIVVDVLPTPLPFLAQFTKASLLFYCHFPDKLLKRSDASSTSSLKRRLQVFITLYRSLMNA